MYLRGICFRAGIAACLVSFPARLTFAQLPDLVPSNVTLSSSSVVAGGSLIVSFTVRNQGSRRVSSTLRHPAWEFSDLLRLSFGRAEPAC